MQNGQPERELEIDALEGTGWASCTEHEAREPLAISLFSYHRPYLASQNRGREAVALGCMVMAAKRESLR